MLWKPFKITGTISTYQNINLIRENTYIITNTKRGHLEKWVHELLQEDLNEEVKTLLYFSLSICLQVFCLFCR